MGTYNDSLTREITIRNPIHCQWAIETTDRNLVDCLTARGITDRNRVDCVGERRVMATYPPSPEYPDFTSTFSWPAWTFISGYRCTHWAQDHLNHDDPGRIVLAYQLPLVLPSYTAPSRGSEQTLSTEARSPHYSNPTYRVCFLSVSCLCSVLASQTAQLRKQ